MKKVLMLLAMLVLFCGITYGQAPTKKFIYRTEVQDSLKSIKDNGRLTKLRVGKTNAVVIDSIRYSANGDTLKFFTSDKKMFRIYKTY